MKLNMTNLESGTLVSIGEELAHENEYLGDKRSTFVEDGKLFAGITGILKVNEKKRYVSIERYNQEKSIIPKKGDWIIGTIDYIRDFSLSVEVHVLNNRLLVESGIYGDIHISHASSKYVKKLDEVFQVNDIIRGKVVGKSSGEVKIATNLPKTGVLYSECKFCGHEMKRIGE